MPTTARTSCSTPSSPPQRSSRGATATSPIERGELFDFLDRNGFLSVFTRRDIFDAFDLRLRHFDESGSEAAVDDLRRLVDRLPARLVVEAAERVAAADRRI